MTYTPAGSTSSNTTTVNVASNDPLTPYAFNVAGTGLAQPVGSLQGGNAVTIANGDVTPLAADGTEFGAVEMTARLDQPHLHRPQQRVGQPDLHRQQRR